MSAPLIAFVGIVYFVIAVNSAIKREWWQAVVFAGYAFSNVGLYWMAK